MTPLEELIGVLQLKPIDDNHFEGQPIDLGFPRLFGGHVLGQSLYAAGSTINGFRTHSLHAYFVRPGDASETIRYEVDRVRDGRTFSTRSVTARQRGKPIFIMSCSFQKPEEGLSHQITRPYAPQPEAVTSDLERTRKIAHMIPATVREKFTSDGAFESRSVDPTNPFKPVIKQPEQYTWVKTAGPVPDNRLLHEALLAYCSDFRLLGTSMLPHGRSYAEKSMECASLDHAMWFHRDLDISQWLLYAMDSPSSSRARGFNRGNFFTQAGELVASTCQEGLIRERPPA